MNTLVKYPIGIQTFEKIIEGGYTYVDKTGFIRDLVNEGQYIFLSRPRRFGKSLLLSSCRAFFEGKRELFRGLEIDREEIDWTPAPVLHFDFNAENFLYMDGLDRLLDSALRGYEEIYGRDNDDVTPAQRFRTLIKTAYETTGRKVAILIDEYDKPLLAIEDKQDLFEHNQTMLKGFFGILKSMDAYIRFALITGVARFNKVSIFSDVNNLKDISLHNRYANICGWTEAELIANFTPGITELADKKGIGFDEMVATLRNYYDGYLFAEEGDRLYNPFSVMMALDSQTLRPYWFDTGTPTFLVKRVKACGIDPAELNYEQRSYRELISVGMGMENPVALMFQTGYLTIDSFDSRRNLYNLRFPNREVEISFAESLLPLYLPVADRRDSPFSLRRFQDDLYEGKPESFMKRLESLFKDLPGEDHHESTYRALTYLLCLLSGTEGSAERHSYRGRSDMEILTPDYIYIFEFKYNRTVEAAMNQIKERDYAGRYAADPRKVFLIGANFNEAKETRGLTYDIEPLFL